MSLNNVMFIHLTKDQSSVIHSDNTDLYQYTVWVGEHSVQTVTKNSYWYIQDSTVVSTSGSGQPIYSKTLCVEIYGYTPEHRSSTFSKGTDLPYINGCSTKQLISPNRLGDPTWQMLYMPENTSEQFHHIHSTARVVYVQEGRGWSHIGNNKNDNAFELNAGDILILKKMIPHHFSTGDTPLTVLPLHVFSSVDSEFNHPMYNGTHRT